MHLHAKTLRASYLKLLQNMHFLKDILDLVQFQIALLGQELLLCELKLGKQVDFCKRMELPPGWSVLKPSVLYVGPYRVHNHGVERCPPLYDQTVLNIVGVWCLKGTD